MMLSPRLFVRAVSSLIITATVAVQPAAVFALTPDDVELGEQWYLQTIHALEAWDVHTGSHDVVVAVLDTGVDLDHPDLAANLWDNLGEIADNDTDDDGNGYVDDVHGWDFIDGDATPEPHADAADDVVASHGTMIAGIVGAQGNNAQGTAGIAWHVSIMPLRMLDASGSGDSDVAARAVDYAVANGADVINMSFAGIGADATLRRAIHAAYEAGVVVVAAMGNESEDTDDAAVYPACLMDETSDWVIGVAATGNTDEPSAFSNYGRSCTDISAPGEDVFGAMYYDPAAGFSDAYAGGWSGTSVASPIVAGAAALLLSAYPDLTVDEVRNALKLSVDPLRLPQALRGKFGAGRLNVAQALAVGAQFSEQDAPARVVADNENEAYVRPPASIALGATSGKKPLVALFDANGRETSTFAAYADGFLGGIRVALGDVDDAAGVEVVTGTGDGGGPQVRVFTAQGALVGQFFAYDESSRNGVSVATGDVDGDGVDEIVTAIGSGVSRDIIAWTREGAEVMRVTADAFFAQEQLRVAAGDVDGDGKSEFVVTNGKGSVPKVVVYDDTGAQLASFAPYASAFTGGVYVALGDVDGDGVADIVTGTGDGGGPHVRIFDAQGGVKGQFFAFDAATDHGVVVAVVDADRNGIAEIVAAPGPEMQEIRLLTAAGALMSSWAVAAGGGEGIMMGAW